MNKFLSLVGLIVLSSTLYAQTVTVTKRTERIKGESADGYATDLDGKTDDVKIALGKFLKDAGKSKSNGEMTSIGEPVINGTVYSKGFLYATASGSDQKARVWIGIIASEWNAGDVESVSKEIEQMVNRFAIKFYRDKIQLQIDEGQQAADAVLKQTQRTTNEGKTLTNKLKNNDEEKIRLEKALEANKLEDLVLKQKIVNNKKSLDSLSQAGVKIQQVIESHKARQAKVN